ncbi:MAG TPA: winged helix-turn-helix transcriptional regulator [Acidimicrobiales bacterium]|nr:winged helix-turn-helix transcriptional regulator [Acidimicrobiales bacterium]
MAEPGWTFVTTHTLVLLCIAEDPEIRLSHIAAQVGVTERRVQSIIGDLVASGYVTRTRQGRRNRYQINGDLPLRHVETEHRQLGELLGLLTSQSRS